jgi:hypothetical protein
MGVAHSSALALKPYYLKDAAYRAVLEECGTSKREIDSFDERLNGSPNDRRLALKAESEREAAGMLKQAIAFYRKHGRPRRA